MAPPHEAELLTRARQGDLDAFDALVAAHLGKIHTFCRWHLRDDDDAADAAQDTFIRAFRHLAKFRGDCTFGTWLHRIAINVARDAARKRGNSPRAFSSMGENSDGEAWNEDHAPDEPDARPAETALRRERQSAVRAALSKLPLHHRDVLVLFDIEGHAYEDVASILKLPLGTVKSRLNRARAALRDALGESRSLFGNEVENERELCSAAPGREERR